ncbi:helix-turn-helix domain-containing protein [Nitrosomonas halophila]|uniref:Helix-turn-helix n=1 Tax=Nitrosomonas halophila TaxID=44576 RepID=A0A1H3NYX2_9PROT|nr:helix-turn-helix transcriptional regulator [Nitrosomonas halophila]SDY94008.1 Helix-turn-helix [Nitrosomonas halophila]
MTAKPSLPEALRRIRKARGISQEAFSNVSCRTYLSSLERRLKSLTLKKVEELCEVLDVHPLTLLAVAYFDIDPENIDECLSCIKQEIDEIRLFETKTERNWNEGM